MGSYEFYSGVKVLLFIFVYCWEIFLMGCDIKIFLSNAVELVQNWNMERKAFS